MFKPNRIRAFWGIWVSLLIDLLVVDFYKNQGGGSTCVL